MKIGATMMAAVLLSSCMALAQVCVPSPGTVCLVPAPAAVGTTTATVSASAVTPLPLTSVAVVGGCPTGMTTPQISSISGMGGTPIILGVMPTSSNQYMMPSGNVAYMPMSNLSASQYGSMGGNIAYVPISNFNAGQFASAGSNFALVPISSFNASAGQCATGNSFALVPMSSIGSSQFTTSSGNVAYIPVQLASSSGMSSMYPSGVTSPDTAAILNELRATRAQILAAQLEVRGQTLVDRMNNLQAQEMSFRQQLAANPNLPNAQIMANNLQAQATSLNNDIAAFNRELALVPSDIRPQLASSLNTFDVAYWTPAFSQFAMYQASWPQTATTYQPLFAANPWLQPWWTSYQSSLNNIAMAPTTYVTARWWATPQFSAVAGSTEVYPGGSIMMLPSGAAIYFPPGTMPMSTSMTTVMPTTSPQVITPAATTPMPPATGTTGAATTTTTTPATGTTGTTGTTGMY